MSFTTLLIANRGEIACRIIATARRMGIATLAVYSDADAGAQHVRMADRALRIGPPDAADSYLNGTAILDAARRSGAEAIHPGYGFLSENADFAEAVARSGRIFVGPPAPAIRAMGLKDAAKACVAAAGVRVVPGYHGADQSPDLLAREAERIGYPVLIKARAGGGGKGMRRVDRPGDFASALAGAQSEGHASFGDPAVLIERCITAPRHVEIQIFADIHGNVVHLFERDCSLQRRHQKVIEEAPAPGMPEAVRNAMGQAAVEAARAVGYVGAGTVEFIADASAGLRPDGFWFMEMNTRLQVEHPVSEAITGLDFVALQLRVAAGEALPFRQDDLRIDGHAIEARLYAEDPARGFLPATGRLYHLALPRATAFEAGGPLRIDSGVVQGDTITPWYDPMIAKVIVHAADRATALAGLAASLDRIELAGCQTNRAFLAALARDPDVTSGTLDTGLIARKLEVLSAAPLPPPPVQAVAALAALELLTPAGAGDPWSALMGFHHWSPMAQSVTLALGDEQIGVRVTTHAPGRFTCDCGTGAFDLSAAVGEAGRVEVTCDGLRETMGLVRQGKAVTVFATAGHFGFVRADPLADAETATPGDQRIVAPMPGRVQRVLAAVGDRVERGAALLVIEAMKMEHSLTAPRDGTIAQILVGVGDQVGEGDRLILLESDDG